MEKLKLYTWQWFINSIVGFVLIPIRVRYTLYKLMGIDTKSKNFEPKIKFYSNKISIGEGTYVNKECYFYNHEKIHIGEKCFFAPQVLLLTISHEIGGEEQRAGKFFSAPIKIKNGTWIGARATILPGVTIGEGCIIAAGAVVNKDCEPNGVYAGVPAKRIKDLC